MTAAPVSEGSLQSDLEALVAMDRRTENRRRALLRHLATAMQLRRRPTTQTITDAATEFLDGRWREAEGERSNRSRSADQGERDLLDGPK